MHEHHPERVVDLVGDAGRELAHAGQLLGLHERLLSAGQFLVGGVELVHGPMQLLDGVGQAHLGFGQPHVHRRGMLDAGGVAAGAAVELVLGTELAHARQDAGQLLPGGHGHALVLHREAAAQVHGGTALDRLAPGPLVLRPQPLPDVLAHPRPAGQLGVLDGHAGSHDAAVAAQDFEQSGGHRFGGELADRLVEAVAAAGAHHVVDDQILVDRRRPEQPPLHREDRAQTGVRRVELAGDDLRRVQGSGGQDLPQFGEGQRPGHLPVQLVAERLAPLGQTGADEDDPEVRAIQVVEGAGAGHHRRDDRRQEGHQLRVVLLDEAHHRRAGGGDVAALALALEQAAVLHGYQIGAEAYFADQREAEGAEHAHQDAGLVLVELGSEARGEDGRGPACRRQQLKGLVGRARGDLGALVAHAHAVAAADAALGDDLGLPLADADRLGGTLAYALVAGPAAIPYCLDQRDVGGTSHGPPLPGRGQRPPARYASTCRLA